MTRILIVAALAGGLMACSGGATQTPTATVTPYCADLKTLDDSLQRAQDYNRPGPANAYAAAELQAASRIYSDAGSSSDAKAARDLALALTIDGRMRQQANPDPMLLSHAGQDVLAAVRAAPGC